MRRIFKYTFYDGLRSRWTILYFLFFLLSAAGLLGFSGSLSKAIVNLMQITIIITPMVSTVFSVMYYYHSRDFIELLLAQPLKRSDIFLGQFFGMSVSLAAGFFLGVFIPFTAYGLLVSGEIWNFLALILSGVMLTLIYSALAFCIALLNENRVKGFGLAILFWLYTAVIYDGLILLFFVAFSEYPLETPAIVLTLLNPIDLSRVFILLQLDVSALMGYTGAVINSFFGETSGMILSLAAMLAWFFIPLFYFIRRVKRTDF